MSRYRWLAALLVALVAGVVTACGAGGEASATPTAEATADVTATPALTPTPTRTPLPPEAEAHTMIPPAVEESALAAIRERGAARVGVLFNYPPFGYLAEDGELRGYEVALARQIGERWGVDIEFVQVTRQTRLPALLAGEVDFVGAAVPHLRELEQMVEFSDTTFRGGYKLMIRAESAEDVDGALAIGPVGVVDEDAADAVALEAGRRGIEAPVERYDDIGGAVAALQGGEIGSIAARREQLMLAVQGSEGVAILEPFLLEEPYAFVVRKGDVPLRDLLSLTVQDMVAEGTIGEIFSTNFYGIPADVFPERAGEPAFTFETFPAEIPQGEPVIGRLQNGEPLRVAGLELAEEPAAFDSQPVYDGYNRALVNEIARRWNVPVVELPDTAGEAGLERLAAGEADLVVGVPYDRSLVGVVALSQPTQQRGVGLIHLVDVAVQGVLDLNTRPTVAVEPADVSRDLIEDNNQAPRAEEVDSFEEAYDRLMNRSAYAVVGDEVALALMAQSNDLIVMDERRYRPRDVALALPRYDPDFLALVNFTLQDMAADGTLESLRAQYIGPYLPEDADLEPLPIEFWPGSGDYLGFGE
jgi:polar amino acid transport system substrate-binding protein